MDIKEKIFINKQELEKYGPINIVAFGDSLTHGALAEGEINYETVYFNRLRKKILKINNYVPVNVINAGIGGVTAQSSINRVESQVLIHNPDLIIICFGLNDVNGLLEDYINSLEIIFKKCLLSQAEIIFMTPNMLNTYVAEDTDEHLKEYARITSEFQNNGKMDLFIKEACKLAVNMNIKVCDCYSEWKRLSKKKDTTKLLANRINHPVKEMHKLFADNLFKIIFNEEINKKITQESSMFKK